MDAKLKECPFCGASGEESYHRATESYYIACSECTAHTCQHGADKADAAAAWNQRVAIAPPVAAGSVDIEDVLDGIDKEPSGDAGGWWETSGAAKFGAQVKAEILAWGAQQREAGKQEAIGEMMDINRRFLRRSEKAEADLKQVNEWRAAALAESQTLGELWASKAEKAEAEVEFMKQVGMKEVEQANKVHARNLELEARVKELEEKVDELESSLEEIVHRGE